MTVDVLAFGIARDILGASSQKFTLHTESTIQQLKDQLSLRYPRFDALKKYDIAVNQEYRNDEYVLRPNDEIVIIPPVSGG